MAAIATTNVGRSFSIRAEDIDDAETDKYWLKTPEWATYAQVWFVMEVKGGTSVQLAIHTVPPLDRDDDHEMLLKEIPAFTAVTSADVTGVVDIGPGVTGIADAVTGDAAADSYVVINCVLPDILGVWVIGAGANNTYDLDVVFRRG